MPVDWKKYPPDWKAIALKVKEEAGWQCEECGRPCRKPGVRWEEFELWLYEESSIHYPWWNDIFELQPDGLEKRKPQRFTLTVAHLDDANPMNCDRANLKALCSGCHLRFDAKLHAKNAATTRTRKKEQLGQLTLLIE